MRSGKRSTLIEYLVIEHDFCYLNKEKMRKYHVSVLIHNTSISPSSLCLRVHPPTIPSFKFLRLKISLSYQCIIIQNWDNAINTYLHPVSNLITQSLMLFCGQLILLLPRKLKGKFRPFCEPILEQSCPKISVFFYFLSFKISR